MVYAIESIGTLISSVGLLSAGMAFGIIGLILGIMRSISSEKGNWGIVFSGFAWAFSLIIPVYWGAIVFGMGTLGLVFSFMPLMEKFGKVNIYKLAILAGFLNLALLTGTDAYAIRFDWDGDYESSLNDINTLLGTNINTLDSSVPTYKLCKPGELDENNEPCKNDFIKGSIIQDSFTPLATIITLATWLGKVLAFLGMVLLAPIVLGISLHSNVYFTNDIILLLMSFVVVLFELSIFYQLSKFIFKRGEGG